MIEKLKKIKNDIEEWAKKEPAKFISIIGGVLILFFIGGIIRDVYFPKETFTTLSKPLPALYNKSDKVIKNSKESEKEKTRKMSVIVKELEELKIKRDSHSLTESDSIRIEYLYNQYNLLKNGEEKTQF